MEESLKRKSSPVGYIPSYERTPECPTCSKIGHLYVKWNPDDESDKLGGKIMYCKNGCKNDVTRFFLDCKHTWEETPFRVSIFESNVSTLISKTLGCGLCRIVIVYFNILLIITSANIVDCVHSSLLKRYFVDANQKRVI